MFRQVIKAVTWVSGGILTILAVWFAYLSIPESSQCIVDRVVLAPVSLWIPLILIILLVACLVVLLNLDQTKEKLSKNDKSALAYGLTHEILHNLLAAEPGEVPTGLPNNANRLEDPSAFADELPDLLFQLMSMAEAEGRETALNRWSKAINILPEVSVDLLDTISYGRHLELEEYNALLRGPLREPLLFLRRRGFLVPVTKALSEEIVYFLPSSAYEEIRAALLRVPTRSAWVHEKVAAALSEAGYDFGKNSDEVQMKVLSHVEQSLPADRKKTCDR